MRTYDVIIIGAGPAGLNAALVLGRCKRKVLIFDAGLPRNHKSSGIHNYLTREGILPASFLIRSRNEIKKYGVRYMGRKIVNAKKLEKDLFEVEDHRGMTYYSKRLLIATGVRDMLPEIEGFEQFFGKSVFHCPYCDGWEVRNKKIGIYARRLNGTELALALKTWSIDVTYYTDGKKLSASDQEKLATHKIALVNLPIKRLEGRGGQLKKIVFKNDESRNCDAIFFVNGYKQQSDLVIKMGCIMNKQGSVITNRMQQTNIEGLYVAGDASKDVQFVVVAAGEGSKAGVAINKDLQKAEMGT